jgi:hypothetical protein
MISNDHKIYKKNRSSHWGGGVILGLRKGIKSLLVTGFQSILVHVFSKSNKLWIVSIYMTPNPNQIQFN